MDILDECLHRGHEPVFHGGPENGATFGGPFNNPARVRERRAEGLFAEDMTASVKQRLKHRAVGEIRRTDDDGIKRGAANHRCGVSKGWSFVTDLCNAGVQ